MRLSAPKKICDLSENLPEGEQRLCAFLIAVAPELLDALTLLIGQIDSLHGESSCIGEVIQQGPEYLRALSIIATAKAGAA
jgi:hypothetical protein